MIDLSGIRKRYGRARARTDTTEALRGVTLQIEAGAVTAVVGPNGAGKTTLFGIALGFLSPSAGDALIEGEDPRDWLRRNGAGWLPERFTPPPSWRVEEMVRSLASLDRRRNADFDAQAMLERFGLGAYVHRHVSTLSRGLLQRVGLAQALVGQHRLIVLDEPTGGLDPEGRATFRDALAELRQRQATVLLASHDIAEIERTADRVVLLDQGTVRDVVAARTPADYSRFTLVVSAPESVLRASFADATPVRSAGADEENAQRLSFVVSAPDVADFNRRLAALIAAGGIVYKVEPTAVGLETRIAELRNAEREPGSS